MTKVLTTLAASVVALGALLGAVEAKNVFYEINGERYSYDTNNRQQTVTARKRIEAAKTAEAATAQAAAERASNPLVGIFGSQTQREAEAARAHLQQIIAEPEAAGKRQRAVQATKDESAAKPANEQAGETAGVNERAPVAAAAIAAAQPTATRPTAPAPRDPAEAARPDSSSRAAIRSISLDAETSIKTVIRVDGSIHEELFDPSLLSTLDPAPRPVGSASNATGTDQSRKISPEDTTGSTSVQERTLRLHAGTDPRGKPLSN
jgi:hypothetical protein